MSKNKILSIELLPVELFHRIFDHLDIETIFFQIRSVCRLFRSIVDSYNRYVLNMKSISKSNFYILCRLIKPENVISLILSNDAEISDQIELFISLVHLKNFTRLHSLTLLNIDDNLLNIIFKKMKFNLLKEFTFSIKTYNDKCMKTTVNLLSSIIAQSTLEKLESDARYWTLPEIFQSTTCRIQYLTINLTMSVTHIYSILQSTPHLHTLIIKTISSRINNNSISNYFLQLRSLTIKESYITINELESFLLTIPSLRHLKLYGGKDMMNGKQWEEFITINLFYLIQFQFYFIHYIYTKPILKDLEFIFTSFQTSFWIELKKWFVICKYDYTKLNGWSIRVYSIPICKSYLYYMPESENSSLSTYPTIIDKDISLMNNIVSLSLTLNKSLADDIQEKSTTTTTTNYPVFSKVTEIQLDFEQDWSIFSLKTLSIFINISQIVRMKISFSFYQYNQNIWIDISNWFKQAQNLSLLIIQGISYETNVQQTTDYLYSILPYHLKHLQIPIYNLNQIELILKQCIYIATIRFQIKNKNFLKKIINWFADNTIHSTCQNNHEMISIWLGNRIFSSIQTNIQNKRIKFN